MIIRVIFILFKFHQYLILKFHQYLILIVANYIQHQLLLHSKNIQILLKRVSMTNYTEGFIQKHHNL